MQKGGDGQGAWHKHPEEDAEEEPGKKDEKLKELVEKAQEEEAS